MLSMEGAVWVDVMPLMLRIFSTVLNALESSLVFNLITRSKRPVTGVMEAMLLILLSWLMIRPGAPLAFAKTKLIDSDLDIVVLKSLIESDAISRRLNQEDPPVVTRAGEELEAT